MRAYVFGDDSLIGDGTQAQPHGVDPGVPRALIAIKNTGQTPAHEVRHWGAIDIKRLTEEFTLKTPSDLKGGSVSTIPAQGTNTKTVFFGRVPTAHEVSEIQTGVSAVYVWGRISYRDIYGRRHQSNYRLRYSGAWPPREVIHPTFCEDGNDAEQNS